MSRLSAGFSLSGVWLRGLVILCLGLNGCESKGTRTELKDANKSDNADKEALQAAMSDPLSRPIIQFCGACHAFPQPSSFPKDMWYTEVRRGFDFYYQSGRTDLQPPPQADVAAWFRSLAPDVLPAADQTESTERRLSFETTDLWLTDRQSSGAPAVSFVDVRFPEGRESADVWISDMRLGTAVQLADIQRTEGLAEATPTHRRSFSGTADHPAVVRQVDLNHDGTEDLVIADLGSFLPEDHDRGRVVWVPGGGTENPGEPVTLLTGVGRVAEVVAADFDGDGRLDLLVGAFGWHRTGGILLLKNPDFSSPVPAFDSVVVDERPGTIHLLPCDLNEDGRLDFVALISQEFEQVVAFINHGETFEKISLHEAPDPSWGSSGICFADLDGDGDQDIIYTNGDSFDSHLIKPYHGIWFLENTGTVPYTPHLLAAIPGVHRAIAADLDGDGDLDIVAAAMLPEATLHPGTADRMHAMIWLEQLDDRSFRRHVIERGVPRYASMTVSDLNQNGFPDIVAGVFNSSETQRTAVARIFWNQGRGILP